MDEASVVMIVAGAVIILTRGVLLIAPGPIRVQYLRSLLEPMVVRLSGLVWAGIGGLALMYVAKDRGSVADNTEICLYVFIAWQLLLKVILAGPYGNGMKAAWGGMGDGMLRLLGLVALGIGGALIYYGILFD